jgi:hypothetical protein
MSLCKSVNTPSISVYIKEVYAMVDGREQFLGEPIAQQYIFFFFFSSTTHPGPLHLTFIQKKNKKRKKKKRREKGYHLPYL